MLVWEQKLSLIGWSEMAKSELVATLAARMEKVGQTELLNEHSRILATPTPTVRHFAANMDKNRFSDIVLFDESRVKLTPTCSGDQEYIHASWVDKAYILTQTPMNNTLVDFWRMVWQENVTVIVSLNSCEPKDGDEESFNFWPKEIGGKMKVGGERFGMVQVDVRFLIKNKTDKKKPTEQDYVIADLEVLRKEGGKKETRRLAILNYRAWKDSAIPPSSLVQFLESAAEYQDSLAKAGGLTAPPMLIQCPTGARRAGTFCALSICCKQLGGTGKFSAKAAAVQVRLARYGSITNFSQYRTIFVILLNYAKAKKELPQSPHVQAFFTMLLNPASTHQHDKSSRSQRPAPDVSRGRSRH